MIAQQRVLELFEYRDGSLFARYHNRGRKFGEAVGGLNGRYIYVGIGYKQYPLHRLVWIYHFGDIPKGLMIDHIDHDRFNNRIANLRLVTNADNGRNRKLGKNNPNGVLGVRLRNGKWHASITLGTFDTKEEAVAIRRAAEKLVGFHPNHGRDATINLG